MYDLLYTVLIKGCAEGVGVWVTETVAEVEGDSLALNLAHTGDRNLHKLGKTLSEVECGELWAGVEWII